MKRLFGQKSKMTQVFRGGEVIPVTEVRIVTENMKKEELEEIFNSLSVGSKIDVSGLSKGRGFQGVVKRHGFHGAPATHGTKHHLRSPGSIGATGPARVFKGKKMPGRMGGKKVTAKNLEIIEVNKDKKNILLKGSIPGPLKGRVFINLKADKPEGQG